MFRLPVKSYLNLGSACDISLKIIKQCLNIVAKKCVLLNFDNALFYICPFSLGCRVEVTTLENIDPGCNRFRHLLREGLLLSEWLEGILRIPCNLRNECHHRRSQRTW